MPKKLYNISHWNSSAANSNSSGHLETHMPCVSEREREREREREKKKLCASSCTFPTLTPNVLKFNHTHLHLRIYAHILTHSQLHTLPPPLHTQIDRYCLNKQGEQGYATPGNILLLLLKEEEFAMRLIT
jgi:hypothetical protein